MLNSLKGKVITAESVSVGHPDSYMDYVVNSCLDAVMKVDDKARFACDGVAKDKKVVLAGEITTSNKCLKKLLKETVKEATQEVGYEWEPDVALEVYQQSPDIALGTNDGMGEQLGACFTVDTPVLLKDGVKCIGDINIGDEVLSNYCTQKVVGIHNNGLKDFYRVTTNLGRVFNTTLNHKFLTKNGDIAFKDLEDSNLILHLNQNTIDSSFDGYWYLQGLFLGDGYLRYLKTDNSKYHNEAYIVVTNEQLKEVESVLNNLGFNYYLSYDKRCDKVTLINFYSKDISTVCSDRLFYNEDGSKDINLSGLNNNQLLNILRGWIDSDGYIEIQDRNRLRISISNKSFKTLRTIQLIFTSLGINSRINSNDYVDIRCKDKECSRKWIEVSGGTVSRLRCQELGISYFYKKREILESYDVSRLFNSRVSEYVIDYQYLGKFEAFDLTIEDTAHYNVCGIVCHNSDQGTQSGYACNETEGYYPLVKAIADELARDLFMKFKSGEFKDSKADIKTQITVDYTGNVPKATTVVVAASHSEDYDENEFRMFIQREAVSIIEGFKVDCSDVKFIINGTGKFTIYGPIGDSGEVGRKIVVDAYGLHPIATVGGGTYNGKYAGHVDRVGAYGCRYIAKNIVAAGLADECRIDVAYCIGISEPMSVRYDFNGTNHVPEEDIINKVKELFSFSPYNLRKMFTMGDFATAGLIGHFGNINKVSLKTGELVSIPWEQLDLVDELKKLL